MLIMVSKRDLMPLPATLFTPHGVQSFEYQPTKQDFNYMGIALLEAKVALENGDSPIGAVLVHPDGEVFSAQTTEFRENKLMAHAEMNVIEKAREKVGRKLGEMMLYTTAEPCPACSYLLDKGQIGMVIAAATRDDAPEFFRRRDVTIHRVWRDSRRPLTYVRGLRKEESAMLLNAENKKH